MLWGQLVLKWFEYIIFFFNIPFYVRALEPTIWMLVQVLGENFMEFLCMWNVQFKKYRVVRWVFSIVMILVFSSNAIGTIWWYLIVKVAGNRFWHRTFIVRLQFSGHFLLVKNCPQGIFNDPIDLSKPISICKTWLLDPASTVMCLFTDFLGENCCCWKKGRNRLELFLIEC